MCRSSRVHDWTKACGDFVVLGFRVKGVGFKGLGFKGLRI